MPAPLPDEQVIDPGEFEDGDGIDSTTVGDLGAPDGD